MKLGVGKRSTEASMGDTSFDGVMCAGCSQIHFDPSLLEANKLIRKHTYKSGVIVFCELGNELYLVVLKQRESGFYQPFAKGSCIDKNVSKDDIRPTNSLSTAARELKEETGIGVCVRTLRGTGRYNPAVSCKTTLFIVSQPSLTTLRPAGNEIESAEWMRFEDFMSLIQENPSAMSATTRKVFPLVLQVLARSVSVVFSGVMLDACQQYPIQYTPTPSTSVDECINVTMDGVGFTATSTTTPSTTTTTTTTTTTSTTSKRSSWLSPASRRHNWLSPASHGPGWTS